MNMKNVLWVASSQEVVRGFPKQVRSDLGTELRRLQEGLLPKKWKPMPSIGQGVREIRVQYRGQYRVFYIAKFDEAIYVLSAFIKKTQRTPKSEIDLAKQRLREVKRSRK